MVRTMKRVILPILVLLAISAAPASAQVQPAGTGEPLYTNSAQNTMFFEWSGGGSPYRIRYDYYANNALVPSPGPVTTTKTGTGWANWSGVAPLQHGGQYGICAQGQYSVDSLWINDGPNSCSLGTQLGRRAYTTIDRSKPNVGTVLAGGATAIKTAAIPLHIDFSDDVAGPFPANFLCVQAGDAGCSGIYGASDPCSHPQTGGKTTTFECTLDASDLPDGPVSACIIAADASIPDNPNGPDQSGSAVSANHSDAKCDTIVLDRVAPTVTIAGPAAKVVTGMPVTLTVTASDASSGLTGEYAWDFGDRSPAGSGTGLQHTFTDAGTYDVTATTADAAGNTTTAHQSVKVEAPDVPTPTATATSVPTTTVTPVPTTTVTPVPTMTVTPVPTTTATPVPSTTTTAVPSTTTTAVPTTTTTPVSTQTATPVAIQTATPVPTQTTTPDATAPTLLVSAPKRLKAVKRVPVTLTSSAAGTARFALVRGGRIEAQGATRLAAPGSTSYTLKLAKKAKRGKHQLTVTFTTDGGHVTTHGATIKVGTPKRHTAKTRRTTLVGGPRNVLPDGTWNGLPSSG
jgi:PKD repeat protein